MTIPACKFHAGLVQFDWSTAGKRFIEIPDPEFRDHFLFVGFFINTFSLCMQRMPAVRIFESISVIIMVVVCRP